MEYRLPRRHEERTASQALVTKMRGLGWDVWRITPGKYGTAGMPDIYAIHPEHGIRWIETKTPRGKLRPSQKKFVLMHARLQIPVYVLMGPEGYSKLFGPPNWMYFL